MTIYHYTSGCSVLVLQIMHSVQYPIHLTAEIMFTGKRQSSGIPISLDYADRLYGLRTCRHCVERIVAVVLAFNCVNHLLKVQN